MAKKKVFLDIFNSVSEYVTTINERPRVEGAYKCSEREGDSWRGTETYDEANTLALGGDENAASLIGNELSKVSAESKVQYQQRTKVSRSVVGSRPCVAAAVLGHPLSMYRRKTLHVKKPIVTLVYTIGASGSVSGEHLAEVGAKIATAIRNAEHSGVKINLYVGDGSVDYGEIAASYVKIKNSEKDFNLLRMSYPFANAAFLRRHWFRWLETTPINWAKWGSGYGCPIYHDPEAKKKLEAELSSRIRFDVHLTFADADRYSIIELTKMIMQGGK